MRPYSESSRKPAVFRGPTTLSAHRFVPVGYVPLPQKEFKLEVLHGAIALALFAHSVILYAWVTRAFSSGENPLFSKRETRMQTNQVTLLTPPKPGAVRHVRTLGAVSPNRTLPPGPRTRPAAQPIPNARPAPAAKGVRNPGALQYHNVPAPVVNSAPPVLAVANGTGPAVRTGTGTGAQGGDPSGTGNGSGKQGPAGDPNGVAGGDALGGGGGGGGGGVGKCDGDATTSVLDYDNYVHLGIPEPPSEVRQRAAGARNWEDCAVALGLDPKALMAKSQVDPFCRGQRNPTVYEENVLKGKVGSVAVDCVLGADGVPQATLVSPADTGLDTVALRIVRDSSWLPALRNGQPVEYRFRVVVTFSLVSR